MTPASILLTLLALVLPGAKDTNVHEPAFSLTLPGTWQRLTSERDLTYTRDADSVFITVLPAEKTMSAGDRGRLARRIAEMRRQLLMDLAHGQATTTDVTRSENNGCPAYFFSGSDPRNDKRFAVTVVALPRAIVTVALTRPFTASPAGLDRIAGEIRQSVHE
jgi:hypothetical protein